MRGNDKILKTVLAGLFLGLAYVLPFLTGQIPEIGTMLCPMHIPVLLCGFVCGWQWGLGVGLAAPLLRSLTLGMPLLFPMAVCMSAELAVYGAVSGLMYRLLPKRRGFIYCSLLCAMVLGRLAWGGAMLLALGASGFGFGAFLAGALTGALPGIIIQIALVPIAVILIERTGIFRSEGRGKGYEKRR